MGIAAVEAQNEAGRTIATANSNQRLLYGPYSMPVSILPMLTCELFATIPTSQTTTANA